MNKLSCKDEITNMRTVRRAAGNSTYKKFAFQCLNAAFPIWRDRSCFVSIPIAIRSGGGSSAAVALIPIAIGMPTFCSCRPLCGMLEKPADMKKQNLNKKQFKRT